MKPSINQSIHQSINQSDKLSISQLTSQLTDQSTNQPSKPFDQPLDEGMLTVLAIKQRPNRQEPCEPDCPISMLLNSAECCMVTWHRLVFHGMSR